LFVARIERRLRQSGLDLHLSSHMFRRTGATLLEEALLREPEGPVDGVYRVVQGFLRHESISTTMRYLESNPGRQRTALERYRRLLPWPDLAPGKFRSVPVGQRPDLAGGTDGTGTASLDRSPRGLRPDRVPESPPSDRGGGAGVTVRLPAPTLCDRASGTWGDGPSPRQRADQSAPRK
jgi:hypothetical protein